MSNCVLMNCTSNPPAGPGQEKNATRCSSCQQVSWYDELGAQRQVAGSLQDCKEIVGLERKICIVSYSGPFYGL